MLHHYLFYCLVRLYCSWAGLFIEPWMAIGLFVGLNIFALNIFWTLYLSKVPKQLWESLWGIPLFVMRQIMALAKMGNPDKNFKHTEA